MADTADTFLSGKQISERLAIHSSSVIGEIYQLTVRGFEGDARQQATLDTKAGSLLQGVGLSLTVAFSFGTNLTEHSDRFPYYKFVVGMYGFSLFLGFLSGIFALRAIQVRFHRTLSEQEILSQEILKLSEEADEKGIDIYKRYISAHYLEVSHENTRLNEGKAKTLRRGQRLFLGFLFTLVCISLILVWSAISAPARMQGATNTQNPSAPEPQPIQGRGLAAPSVSGPQTREEVRHDMATPTPPQPAVPQQPVTRPQSPPPPLPIPGRGRTVSGNIVGPKPR